MRARQVDGFIAATARRGHELLTRPEELGLPVVLVNRRLEDASLPAVVGDDKAGIRLAVRHLVELGHARIAHLAGPQELSTGYLRYEGFLEAMRDAGLEPDPNLILIGDAVIESEGSRLCADLLDSGREFTAIVAANDLMALGCYDVLEERGIPCPARVSVVGFNDMPFAAHFRPPLSTIRIPQYELGARSAELLLDVLQNGEVPPTQVSLEPELVVRASTGPPPGS
jgi:LacI family transcriptional regulator